MPRTLILDSDGGVDDAQALIMLAANDRPPDVITTVFGNVGRDQATTNLLAVASYLGLDVPVHRGADRPLVQPIIDATYVHGSDGLGGAPRPISQGLPTPDDAVGVLVRTFRAAAAASDKADILMIGPLTNLALALRLAPDIAPGIGRLTIMGGTLHGRGNITPAAEFNFYADPEAAHIVMTAGLDTVVAPWETCLAHFMPGSRVDELLTHAPASPLRDFMHSIIHHYRGVLARLGYPEPENLPYIDPLAAALVIDPGVVTKAVAASSSVELAPGPSRGTSLVDPSGRLGAPMVTFVEEVDLVRMDELFARALGHVPATPWN